MSTSISIDRRQMLLGTLAATALICTGIGSAKESKMSDHNHAPKQSPSADEVRSVSPALEQYTAGALRTNLWSRPGLSRRDRGLITAAALIARMQTVEMPFYFALALDSGVKAAELSEAILHLAFYSGWPNAMAAVAVAKELFHERGIRQEQLPRVHDDPLPLDEEAEAKRASGVDKNFGSVIPGLVQNTTDLLFRDLWLRPALAPRDRSLVTVSALIASGQVAQVTYHLGRAMDNGLTAEEAGEVVTHLAFYAGWPNAFSAAPVVKDVIEKRAK
jgi:4-carboxymuconolactone decarboxylase